MISDWLGEEDKNRVPGRKTVLVKPVLGGHKVCLRHQKETILLVHKE